MMQEYPTKKHINFVTMIKQLKSRGLNIGDEEKAIHYLKHTGYYRLSGYMIPFCSNPERTEFTKDVTFDNILNIYIFDRKLRVLILEAIERIEVSLRAVVVDKLSEHFDDPFFYSNYNNFAKGAHTDLGVLLTKISSQIKTSDELYNQAFNHKFAHVAYPYGWIAFQSLTFGALVTFIRKICNNQQRLIIAKEFDFDDGQLFESWILSLLNLRNLCAHHSRCWNREFRVVPKVPENFLERIIRFVKYDDPLLCFADYKDLKRLVKQNTFAPSDNLRKLIDKIIAFGELNSKLTTVDNQLHKAREISWAGLEYKVNLNGNEIELMRDVKSLCTGKLSKFIDDIIINNSIKVLDYCQLRNLLKSLFFKKYFFISSTDKSTLQELIELAENDDKIAKIISHPENSKFPLVKQQLNTHIVASDRIFAQLVVVWYFLKQINPKSSWSQRLYNLMQEHNLIQGELKTNVTHINMGFPDNWYQNDFWQIII